MQDFALKEGSRLASARTRRESPCLLSYRLLPTMSIEYHVYGNTGAGDPIDYSSPLATSSGLGWTSGSLTFPGTWSFSVRAYDTVSGLEEQNLDCAISIILDSNGNDITNRPLPPTAIRAFALAAGSIRVEWYYPPSAGLKAPTGFNVYTGTGGSPSYGSPAATVAFSTGIANTFVSNLVRLHRRHDLHDRRASVQRDRRGIEHEHRHRYRRRDGTRRGRLAHWHSNLHIVITEAIVMSTNTVGHRITPSLQTGLTALGSTQSTAFPLTNNSWHEFTTVASGTGAILPTGMAPSEIRVFNNGANPLRIYPPVGGTINAGTANLPVSLAAGNGLTYWASSPSNWYSIQSASSSSATPAGRRVWPDPVRQRRMRSAVSPPRATRRSTRRPAP